MSEPVEMTAIAAYMGQLYAAAKHDLDTANPADVGLHGMPIVGWRQAYLEGCKDMATGVVARVPEAQREEIKTAVLAAFNAKMAALKEPPA